MKEENKTILINGSLFGINCTLLEASVIQRHLPDMDFFQSGTDKDWNVIFFFSPVRWKQLYSLWSKSSRTKTFVLKKQHEKKNHISLSHAFSCSIYLHDVLLLAVKGLFHGSTSCLCRSTEGLCSYKKSRKLKEEAWQRLHLIKHMVTTKELPVISSWFSVSRLFTVKMTTVWLTKSPGTK